MDVHRLTTSTRSGLPIVLSPLAAEDIERIYQLCQDPEIQRWTTVPSPYLREAAEAFVSGHAATAWRQLDDGSFSANRGPELVWGVRIGEGSPLAGLWGTLGVRPHGDGEVEIGWWLGAAARGQGVMRAAVAQVLEVAFAPDGPLRAEAVWWYAFVGNLPSAIIAQRTGFSYAGIVEKLEQPHWSAVIRPGDPIAARNDWPELTS